MPPPATADDHIPNFNTGTMRDRLVNTGTTEATAAGIVDVIVEAQSGLATKASLKDALKQLEYKMEKLKNELIGRIALSEQRMRNFVLTQTIVILTAIIGATFAIIKFGI